MNLSTRTLLVTTAVLTALLCARTAAGEGSGDRRVMRQISGQGVFNLPELGAVIVENDSVLSFAHVMPGDQRPKGYSDVDIKANDVLLMCNGTRLHTADQLKELYDKLEVGATLKFGLRRDKDMMLASLDKADPAALPKVKMVMKTEGGVESGPGGGERVISIDGGGEELMILGKLGFVATSSGDGLKVAKLLPEAESIYGKQLPQEGDIIVALGSTPIKTPEQLDEALAKITSGTKEALSVTRGGEKLTLTFTCPDVSDTPGVWKQD